MLQSLTTALIALLLVSVTDGRASGSWSQLRPAILKRTEVAAARIGGAIYVAGGFEKSSGKTSAQVERYDIERDRWSLVRSMPLALNHAAAVSYRGRLYVAGGFRDSAGLSGPGNGLFRYDPATNRWRRLANMPTARGALAAAVSDGRLFAVGGSDSSGKDSKAVEIYNFKTGRWRKGRPLRVARNHLAAAAAGGSIYVFGGRASGVENFDDVDRYRLASGRWSKMPPLSVKRSGIAAVAIGRKIVVFGGERSSGTIKPVEVLDTRSQSWGSLTGMLTPRHGLGGVSYKGRIFAIEGGPKPGLFYSNKLEAIKAS